MKQIKESHCDQCGTYATVMRFADSTIFRCNKCMQTEGLCQSCGEYIPFLEDNQEPNFAPELCDICVSISKFKNTESYSIKSESIDGCPARYIIRHYHNGSEYVISIKQVYLIDKKDLSGFPHFKIIRKFWGKLLITNKIAIREKSFNTIVKNFYKL